MKKRYIISLATSIALLSTFSMTGCGGGGGGNSNEEGSSNVTVSDAYVLNATVKAGTKVFNTHNGKGVYEIAEANVTGELSATGGINDLNDNNVADQGEPFAPELKAPSGYKNITPFTTMLVNNVNIASEADYQAVAAFAPEYDFDVVKEGATFENGIAQATAIAALRLSAGGDGSDETPEENSIDESLPGAENTASSSSVSVITNSSSSVNVTTSSSSVSGPILPNSAPLRTILPSDENTATPTSSSSVTQSSSSSSNESSQSSSVVSSISSASSSSASNVSDLELAIAKIKSAQNHDELKAIILEYMSLYNGSYKPATSSSSSFSQASSSDTGASSSIIDTADDCLPGFNCDATQSSSISSQTNSVSSTSSSVASNDRAECEANGGTWASGENVCIGTTPVHSSSSVAPATNDGSILPE